GNDDTGEGSSGNPYKSLKHAIEHVSSGDTIMIKPGTYSGEDNRNIHLYPNDSGNFSEKYKNLVITSEKGAAETIFDAGNNGRHFRMTSNSKGSIDSTMQFIGLTFRGGRMNENGGSFHLDAEEEYYSDPYWTAYRLNPKFVNCVFRDNRVSSSNSTVSGGAFYLDEASPIFESCVFDSNYAMSGGAIAVVGNPETYRDTLWIRNSTIKNNAVSDSENPGHGARGGGVSFNNGINAMIYNSVFENNAAVSYSNSGGGVYGGGLDVDNQWSAQLNPMVWIVNSRFSKNKIDHQGRDTNTHGGGIHMGAPHTIVNTVIDSNKATFSGSNGRGMGGGLFIQVDSQWDGAGNELYGNSYLVNSTIVNNLVSSNSGIGENGGVYLNNASTRGVWFNNIFWGNRANYSQDQNQDRHNLSYHEAQNFMLITDYNDIEFMDHYMDTWAGPNSYNMDPGFVNSASNFKLADASPLIGLGTSIYDGIAGPTYDMLNAKRPNPVGSNPDLGAYENALAESPNPKQVRNVVAHPGGESVTLSWSANTEEDIEKYLIYASTQMNFIPTQEDSVGETTDTTFTVAFLTNGTEYHFKITAQDKDGYTGVYSNEVHAIPKYSGPTWWVDVTNGQDKCDGSPESPCPHLSYIFPIMANGDTIRMIAGDYGPGYHLQGENNEWGNNLQELTIIGNTGNPEDVNIWGNDNQQIFQLNDMRVTFRNISFVNGGVGENGGAIATNYGGLNIDNCIFENNKAQGQYGTGGAISSYMTDLIINNSIFRNNKSKQAGGAIIISTDESGDPGSTIFVNITNTQFINNQTHGDNQSGNALGGAISVQPSTKLEMNISHSIFDNNSVYCQHDGSGASGSAIDIQPQSLDSWNDVNPIVIEESIFKNNWSEGISDNNWLGATVRTGWNTHIYNSLFYENRIQHGSSQGGGTIAVEFSFNPSSSELNNVLANNTIVGNFGSNASGAMYASPVDFWNSQAIVFNNIIWDNNGENGVVHFGGNNGVKFNDYNNIQYKSGDNNEYGPNTFQLEPRFKNPSSDNYQLSNNSPLIDMGTLNLEGYNAPITDIRGYYRVGTPDLGAYEAGASKYLLAMTDDIETDEDTTFVELGQELTITITTGDIDGNLVPSNESMSWNIFPNQKYVKFVSGDTDTEGGDASATFQVTDQDRGKGFRFRIEAGVGEAFLRSEMYVIEELVTGAPPPVVELTITPSDWTNQPNFNLNWQTPIWAAQRDLIGAVVEITDGINVHNEYMSFPSGDTLTNYSFTAPEAGQYDAYLWLIDELGNEDKDSSRSVTAYFDDIVPESFVTHNPDSPEEDTFYTSDKPRFEWDDMGDYPSGIKEWQLFINDNHYDTYTRSDVTFDGGSDMGYVIGGTTLQDGYYTWWVEAADSAENITRSDSGFFGVDLSPPKISHSSPLGTIDAGSTTPSINVTVTDGASGVKYATLHSRRSGSGGGFVTLDLTSGPVSIPGSDVKEDGLEYYIDAEDNVGNYDAWPSMGELHAVSVRSEGSITTADSWSNGIPGGTDSTNYVFFSIPFEVG
ncbi:MAG: hypothetical protein HOG73_12630, partial [Candidatus Marinimicrobia bacterium]|nr:hypothetical protein [Candidatus Neomarinimicrobiota bacterium]